MKGDGRGNMPFAMVAVTILVMSVFCGAVMASYERASENTLDVERDNEAVADASAGIGSHIERGLGEIILSLSRDAGLGTMDDRATVFAERASRWLEYQFPIVDHGVRAELVSEDISLVAENMREPSGSELEGGYVPAYLRAVGAVTVSMRTSTGSATVDLDISSDGSYALPLLSDRGSMFETMASGGGLSLSQMMEYQLTCLAQTRVLNGYGALSEYGAKGTSQILTREDVETAYGNAVSAIGLICFRNPTDGAVMQPRVDLADVIASEDGEVTVDLALVYAQALAGVLDEVAVGWFEYFCGDKTSSLLTPDENNLQLLGDMVVSFIKGESVLGAESYIRRVMGSNGHTESEYRYPGTGTTSGTVGGISISVENPTTDLFAQGWIRMFKSDYHLEGNPIMDHIRTVLNLSVSKMADLSGLHSVTFRVDPNDTEGFARSLSSAMDKAMIGCTDGLETCVRESLESVTFCDPFYGAIADAVDRHSDSLVLEERFRQELRYQLEQSVTDGTDVDQLISSSEADSMVRQYRESVLRDLEVFEDLRNVPGGQPGIVDELLATIASHGLAPLGISVPVRMAMDRVCGEMLSLISLDPYGRVVDLPTTGSFRLQDGDGNMTTERIEVDMAYDPVVGRPMTVDGKCVHTVGFGEDSLASYTTVFRTTVMDDIRYSLEGTGTLSEAMGTTSSALNGTCRTDMVLDITVVSAWALAGVDYGPSCTVLSDAAEALMELLEPIIEPLTRMMSLIRGALVEIGEGLMEIGRQIAETVSRMYETLMGPIETLNSWIMENVEMFLSDSALNVMMGIGLNDQYIRAEVMGYTLEVTTNALSWNTSTKTLFTATLSGPVAGIDVSAGITVKAKGDVNRENLVITGNGSMEGNGWSVKAKVDPLMKGSKYLISLDGELDDTDVSLTIPELVDYQELGVTLSDVPGIGTMLGSIPLPALGTTASIDAGFTLRYSSPMQTGLIINEFESNPPGNDNGNEWVEILNNSSHSVDLGGYTLSASSDRKNKTMTLDGTISPGERIIVEPDFILVNDSGKYTKNGEALVLKDPDGNTVDKTPTKKDGSNDDNTWQRRYDGSTEWVFAKGTQGDANGGSSLGPIIPAMDVKDLVWESVQKAFDDVPYITDLETLERYIQSLIKNVIEAVIKKVTAMIVDASVFVSVDVGDAAGVSSSGIRLAITADGDLAGDVLRYAAGKVQQMVLGVKNPYRIDPVGMFTENIGLDVRFHTSMGFPRILSGGSDTLPTMDLGITFRTSLSAITRILGTDTGRPEVMCGITAFNCPTEVVPEKMSPNRNMHHDLWLMRMTVRWS